MYMLRGTTDTSYDRDICMHDQKRWYFICSRSICARSCFCFCFPSNIISTICTKISLQATFLSLSQLIWTNWTSNHLLTTPPILFFYCSQIFFENANHAKDKKVRSTSSHKFPRRTIYLSTKIKALSERYLHSCWGYLIGKITLPTNNSIMMTRNRGHFGRNGDGYRGGYG